MGLVDRLFLSYHSSTSLNVAAFVGSYFMVIVLPLITIASITEVPVSHFNGALIYKKVAIPVWQMVYVGLFLQICIFPFFFPKDHSLLCHPEQVEMNYLRINLLFSPIWMILTAFSAFFIGTGKGRTVQISGLIGNLVNLGLDPIFIFGVKGWVPEMGAVGAALATGTGVFIEACFLCFLFLRKDNRNTYKTHHLNFDLKELKNLIKIGIPSACFVLVQLGGWAVWFYLINYFLKDQLIIASTLQTLLLFFIFFSLGMEKGVIALSGNLIGGKKSQDLHRVITSSIKISLLFYLGLAFCFYLFRSNLVSLFIDPIQLPIEYKITQSLLQVLAFFLLLESIKYVINGVLTSLKDTTFILLSELISTSLFFLLPTYFLFKAKKGSFELMLCIWIIYSLLSSIISYMRFIYLSKGSGVKNASSV